MWNTLLTSALAELLRARKFRATYNKTAPFKWSDLRKEARARAQVLPDDLAAELAELCLKDEKASALAYQVLMSEAVGIYVEISRRGHCT